VVVASVAVLREGSVEMEVSRRRRSAAAMFMWYGGSV
jgi:hypothetical protein